jgi:hypothetical protein
MRESFFVYRLTLNAAHGHRLRFQAPVIDLAAAFVALAIRACGHARERGLDSGELFAIDGGFLDAEIGLHASDGLITGIADAAHHFFSGRGRRLMPFCAHFSCE